MLEVIPLEIAYREELLPLLTIQCDIQFHQEAVHLLDQGHLVSITVQAHEGVLPHPIADLPVLYQEVQALQDLQ